MLLENLLSLVCVLKHLNDRIEQVVLLEIIIKKLKKDIIMILLYHNK